MANPPPADPGSLSQAEQLFAQYQLDLERGEAPDFEALCRRNPEHATELRQLKSDWDRVRAFAQRAGLGSIERASLAEELRSRFGRDVDPAVSLGGAAPGPDSGPSSELLKRLRAHAPANSRYRMLGEVGRGGMGAVLKIWDEDLRRTLAMKVVLGKEDGAKQGSTPSVDTRTLGRFLEEAQVTGQLDHPGIVPVHELGLGSDGRVYFTMRLVKGEDLRKIYEHVESGHEGWNPTRALGVLLKVCEAMSYAHDKGVVHRDLKPANVMVGKYGEVYVMDWGLARVLGQEDRHDVRLRPEAPTSVSVRTERRSERDDTPDSPLVTMDGDVVGTPAYMPPEQARGEVEKLGPHSDVYAVGAMLYHLLTGEMPFVAKGVRVSAHAVLMRLIDGAPKPLIELAPRAPAELVAICEKAMERDIALRYRDMPALAEDLRAYLERRVVKAYESGTWAETKKWVQRNKPLAASLGAGLILIMAGVAIAFSVKNAQVRENRWQTYSANVVAASLFIDNEEHREAGRRLDSCPPEYRDFAWAHARLGVDQSSPVMPIPQGGRALGVSPDGSTTCVWNPKTGVERWRNFSELSSVATLPPNTMITCASMGVQGVPLVVGTAAGQVLISLSDRSGWDRTIEVGTEPITCLDLAAGGATFAAACLDGTVLHGHVEGGSGAQEFDLGGWQPSCLDMDASGLHIVIGTGIGLTGFETSGAWTGAGSLVPPRPAPVFIIDIESSSIEKAWTGSGNIVCGCCWSSAPGQFVASTDSGLFLCDTAGHVYSQSDDIFRRDLKVAEDLHRVYTCYRGSIELRDLPTLTLTGTILTYYGFARVFHSSSGLFAYGDGWMRQYHPLPAPPVSTFDGIYYCDQAVLDAMNDRLVITSEHETCLFETSTGDPLFYTGGAGAIAVDSAHRCIGLSRADGADVSLWFPEQGRTQQIYKGPESALAPEGSSRPLVSEGLKFSADGTLLASCGWEDIVRVWAIPDGQLIATFPIASSVNRAFSFSADSSRIAIAAPDGVLLSNIRSKSIDGHYKIPSGNFILELSDGRPDCALILNETTVSLLNYVDGLELGTAPSGRMQLPGVVSAASRDLLVAELDGRVWTSKSERDSVFPLHKSSWGRKRLALAGDERLFICNYQTPVVEVLETRPDQARTMWLRSEARRKLRGTVEELRKSHPSVEDAVQALRQLPHLTKEQRTIGERLLRFVRTVE